MVQKKTHSVVRLIPVNDRAWISRQPAKGNCSLRIGKPGVLSRLSVGLLIHPVIGCAISVSCLSISSHDSADVVKCCPMRRAGLLQCATEIPMSTQIRRCPHRGAVMHWEGDAPTPARACILPQRK
mmetsp:Transcript_31178/g.77251  ORF Transcript_31178/g.77251 Transcript_31178/m.77251 type:complete len:126 (-) Transcript_31178:136-513(-)